MRGESPWLPPSAPTTVANISAKISANVFMSRFITKKGPPRFLAEDLVSKNTPSDELCGRQSVFVWTTSVPPTSKLLADIVVGPAFFLGRHGLATSLGAVVAPNMFVAAKK